MPTVPFVILIMIPFVEQIDPRVEAAARVFGAGTFELFVHVLVPLLLPGMLAALLLVLVRTIAMFELTFLTAGPTSQTLVVALYYAVFAAGVRRGPVDRRDGGRLHGHHAGLAADRAALRQPDADRRARASIARAGGGPAFSGHAGRPFAPSTAVDSRAPRRRRSHAILGTLDQFVGFDLRAEEGIEIAVEGDDDLVEHRQDGMTLPASIFEMPPPGRQTGIRSWREREGREKTNSRGRSGVFSRHRVEGLLSPQPSNDYRRRAV